jgi:hypothetical protein
VVSGQAVILRERLFPNSTRLSATAAVPSRARGKRPELSWSL